MRQIEIEAHLGTGDIWPAIGRRAEAPVARIDIGIARQHGARQGAGQEDFPALAFQGRTLLPRAFVRRQQHAVAMLQLFLIEVVEPRQAQHMQMRFAGQDLILHGVLSSPPSYAGVRMFSSGGREDGPQAAFRQL